MEAQTRFRIARMTRMLPFSNLLLLASLLAVEPARAGTERELLVHGFRAPAIGPELRWGSVGVFAGMYPTVLTLDGVRADTWWVKAGVSGYLGRFHLTGPRDSSFYVSLAYLRGLSQDWKKNALGVDAGFRWAIVSGLEARLGVALLAASDRALRVNPGVGLSWGFSL